MKGNKSNAEVEIAFMLDWDKRLTRSWQIKKYVL
jgi:hypothetical protein